MEFVDKIEESDAILVGVPVDQGTEKKGCSDAPVTVRMFIDNFFFSETGGVCRVLDKGDIVEDKKFENTMDKIYNKFCDLFNFRRPVITIGGNHSITFPIVKALSRFYNKIGVIHIDAHPDSQIDYYPNGDIIPNILEIREVKRVVSLCLRNWSKYEHTFLEEHRVPYITMNSLIEAGMAYCIEKIKIALHGCDCIYISFDIDAIDPAFAPGTGWIEPGGITSRQAIELVQELAKLENIKGFDIVEINTKKDINDMTSILGAKLIYEFANSLVKK
jgi:agmatinase